MKTKIIRISSPPRVTSRRRQTVDKSTKSFLLFLSLSLSLARCSFEGIFFFKQTIPHIYRRRWLIPRVYQRVLSSNCRLDRRCVKTAGKMNISPVTLLLTLLLVHRWCRIKKLINISYE